MIFDFKGAFNKIPTGATKHALVTSDIKGISAMVVAMVVGKNSGLQAEHIGLGWIINIEVLKRRDSTEWALAPLLWVLALVDILKTLDKKGVKVVAYAYDVVMLTVGKSIDVISEVAERSFRMVCKWAESIKVSALIRRKLRWFTRKTKTLDFPTVNRLSLELKKKTRYTGRCKNPGQQAVMKSQCQKTSRKG